MGFLFMFKDVASLKRVAAKLRKFVTSLVGGTTPPTYEEEKEQGDVDPVPTQEQEEQEGVAMKEQEPRPSRRRINLKILGTVLAVGAFTVAKALKKS